MTSETLDSMHWPFLQIGEEVLIFYSVKNFLCLPVLVEILPPTKPIQFIFMKRLTRRISLLRVWKYFTAYLVKITSLWCRCTELQDKNEVYLRLLLEMNLLSLRVSGYKFHFQKIFLTWLQIQDTIQTLHFQIRVRFDVYG